MDKLDPLAGYPVTGDLFRLLFLATTRIKKTETRRKFLAAVDMWLDDFESAAETKRAAKECKRALHDTKGTTLEPLIVEPWDVEIAMRFYRMAIHFGGMDTGSEKALLIGSRDAIGGGGGLYLNQKNKPVFLCRFPYGKETPFSERTWSFSPQYEAEAVEETRSIMFDHPFSRVYLSGGTLVVPLKDNGSLNWQYSDFASLEDDLKRHSTIGENDEGFGRFGLAVHLKGKNILIEAEHPEAMLRLSAVMSQGGSLALDPEGSAHGSLCALNVKLAEPDEDNFEFKATVHSRDTSLSDWMRLPALTSYPLIDREVLSSLLEEFEFEKLDYRNIRYEA